MGLAKRGIERLAAVDDHRADAAAVGEEFGSDEAIHGVVFGEKDANAIQPNGSGGMGIGGRLFSRGLFLGSKRIDDRIVQLRWEGRLG